MDNIINKIDNFLNEGKVGDLLKPMKPKRTITPKDIKSFVMKLKNDEMDEDLAGEMHIDAITDNIRDFLNKFGIKTDLEDENEYDEMFDKMMEIENFVTYNLKLDDKDTNTLIEMINKLRK
jgi:hypothetical protein